jgi:hypothetical protein
MDDLPQHAEEDHRECGACWAVPGAMLLTVLVVFAFLSQFAQIDTAIARNSADSVMLR